MARVTAQRLLAILLDAPQAPQQPATFIPYDPIAGLSLYTLDATWSSHNTVSGLAYQTIYGNYSMSVTGSVGATI
jgi:hypothetical protein